MLVFADIDPILFSSLTNMPLTEPAIPRFPFSIPIRLQSNMFPLLANTISPFEFVSLKYSCLPIRFLTENSVVNNPARLYLVLIFVSSKNYSILFVNNDFIVIIP